MKKVPLLKMKEKLTLISEMHQQLLRLVAQEAHTEKTENLGHHLLPPPSQT